MTDPAPEARPPVGPPGAVPAFPLGGPARIAVLVSGRGSNLRAIHAACGLGGIPGAVVGVVSDVADAPALAWAGEEGIATFAIPRAAAPSRREHEAEILRILERLTIDLVCLAGYMRVLSADFVSRWPWRILNVHPSLLPAFPGLGAQGQALAHGVKVSGCTVHFVNAGLDSGPIVAQRAVDVLDSDDEESLAARILDEEHRIYPEAIRAVLEGRWRASGRRIVSAEPPRRPEPRSV